MKKSKRILVLVLVLALAFTSFAMFASASETEAIQPRGLACPLCGNWIYTSQERVFKESVPVGSCSNKGYTHTHDLYDVYERQDCTSCSYYARPYRGVVSVCA